jgi:hypothetical protein
VTVHQPDITYIIATYQRPQVLHATLRALCLQNTSSWEAVVVGDCCDEQTLAAIRAIGDPRIRYYNLPARYGEQGGPNSVGLVVARGRWVAFLNHDDLLLPDHTECILGAVERGNVDVVGTRFVSVGELRAIGPTRIDAEFRQVFPAARSIREVMARPIYTLEPASAWAIRRQTALGVGPWRSWRSVHRVPWHDWMIRILKTRARWHFDQTVTGICVLTHHDVNGPLYGASAGAHQQLVDAIANTPANELRRLLADAGALDTPASARNRLQRVEQTMGLGLLRLTKQDYVAAWRTLRNHDPEVAAKASLNRRTGETAVRQDLLPMYLDDPEALRTL